MRDALGIPRLLPQQSVLSGGDAAPTPFQSGGDNPLILSSSSSRRVGEAFSSPNPVEDDDVDDDAEARAETALRKLSPSELSGMKGRLGLDLSLEGGEDIIAQAVPVLADKIRARAAAQEVSRAGVLEARLLRGEKFNVPTRTRTRVTARRDWTQARSIGVLALSPDDYTLGYVVSRPFPKKEVSLCLAVVLTFGLLYCVLPLF